MSLAGPDQMFVSWTTIDRLDGSDVVLEEDGTYEPRGLSGRRVVLRLVKPDQGCTLTRRALGSRALDRSTTRSRRRVPRGRSLLRHTSAGADGGDHVNSIGLNLAFRAGSCGRRAGRPDWPQGSARSTQTRPGDGRPVGRRERSGFSHYASRFVKLIEQAAAATVG
jgi:hypothetical protein